MEDFGKLLKEMSNFINMSDIDKHKFIIDTYIEDLDKNNKINDIELSKYINTLFVHEDDLKSLPNNYHTKIKRLLEYMKTRLMKILNERIKVINDFKNKKSFNDMSKDELIEYIKNQCL